MSQASRNATPRDFDLEVGQAMRAGMDRDLARTPAEDRTLAKRRREQALAEPLPVIRERLLGQAAGLEQLAALKEQRAAQSRPATKQTA